MSHLVGGVFPLRLAAHRSDQPCWEAVFKFVMMRLSVELGVGRRRGAKEEEPTDGNGFARLSQMGNPDLDPVAADRSRRVPKHMLPLAYLNAVLLLRGATAPDRVAVSQIARCRFCT